MYNLMKIFLIFNFWIPCCFLQYAAYYQNASENSYISKNSVILVILLNYK